MPRCQQCSQPFTRQATLKRHLQSKHAEERCLHQCSECHEYFARNDILERHRQNCHGAGKKTCRFCSQSVRSDHLAQHMRRCESRCRVRGQVVLRDVNLTANGQEALFDRISNRSTFSPQHIHQPSWTTQEATTEPHLTLRDTVAPEHTGFSRSDGVSGVYAIAEEPKREEEVENRMNASTSSELCAPGEMIVQNYEVDPQVLVQYDDSHQVDIEASRPENEDIVSQSRPSIDAFGHKIS